MDATELVNALGRHRELTELLAEDPGGAPAIYQVTAPRAEVIPRIMVFEADREYTDYADDVPLRERVLFELDLYAMDNILFPLNAALHQAMRREGFQRVEQNTDDYLLQEEHYVKSVFYATYVELPLQWATNEQEGL